MALGTFYNYFSSKQDLVYALILNDWENMIANSKSAGKESDSLQNAIAVIYREMIKMDQNNHQMFSDDAGKRMLEEVIAKYRDYCVDSFSDAIVSTAKHFGENPDEEMVRLMSMTLCTTIRFQEIDHQLLKTYAQRMVQPISEN